MIQAIYDEQHRCLANQIQVPSSHWAKMRGLLLYRQIPKGFAMIFEHVRQIHTFFMAFPIDLVHVDADMKVIHCQTIKPWRIGPFIRETRWIIEGPQGTFSQVSLGDQLYFKREGGDFQT